MHALNIVNNSDLMSKKKKMAYMIWAFINNNIVTQNMYLLLIVLDFVYQMLMIAEVTLSICEIKIDTSILQ
jgi:hypothetical protein